MLTSLMTDPARPFVVVLGGAKVTDKIGVIERFLETADAILVGGAMCFSFFRALGHQTGDSLVEEAGVEEARRLLELAQTSRCRLELPEDLVLADRFDAGAERATIDGVEVPSGRMGLDIGPRTAERYAAEIRRRRDRLLERPDGRFRARAVRRRHPRGRGGARGLHAARPWSAAATPRRRSRGSASATASRTCQPAAGRRSSCSRAGSSRAWRHSMTDRKKPRSGEPEAESREDGARWSPGTGR